MSAILFVAMLWALCPSTGRAWCNECGEAGFRARDADCCVDCAAKRGLR